MSDCQILTWNYTILSHHRDLVIVLKNILDWWIKFRSNFVVFRNMSFLGQIPRGNVLIFSNFANFGMILPFKPVDCNDFRF